MKLCPKCGKENHCAIENKKDYNKCWCMNITVIDSLKTQLSHKYPNQGCLCQSCLEDEIISYSILIKEKSKTV